MQCEWDFFATASFLYWQPMVDNFDVAFSDFNSPNQQLVQGLGVRGSFVEMDFDFKPGFKVAAGLNLQNDDWVAYAEYTRLHSQHHVSSSVPVSQPSIFATWGHPSILFQINQIFTSVSAKYHCNLDFVDAEMERVYYVGKSLIFHSTWGGRGAWITQNMHVHYEDRGVLGSPTAATFPSIVDVYGRLHSWAVGPRGGLEMDWMLGEGIRFFGSSFADILYTKYKVQDKTVATALSTITTFTPNLLPGQTLSFISRDKVIALRTHLDLEAGFGWGMYLDNNSWHIDLSAAYGFQVFFNQNMFQHFEDNRVLGTHLTEHGNLYVQGLTVTGRVDF